MKIRTEFTVIGLFILILLCFSCSTSEEHPLGKWDDNIKLSQKKVQFTIQKDSIVITTKGEWWWVNEISLNGNSNFDLKSIDTSAKNFVIEESEFRIERKNATEIHIKMTKNETGSERVLIIGLEAGDYFDGIKIMQSSN